MSSAHPLAALLTGHFDAIMERERTNRSSVHLYGAGDYWVAFEQSAYQLCQLMPSCETTLFRFAVYPFPVVMASVTDARPACLQGVLRPALFGGPLPVVAPDAGAWFCHFLGPADPNRKTPPTNKQTNSSNRASIFSY